MSLSLGRQLEGFVGILQSFLCDNLGRVIFVVHWIILFLMVSHFFCLSYYFLCSASMFCGPMIPCFGFSLFFNSLPVVFSGVKAVRNCIFNSFELVNCCEAMISQKSVPKTKMCSSWSCILSCACCHTKGISLLHSFMQST